MKADRSSYPADVYCASEPHTLNRRTVGRTCRAKAEALGKTLDELVVEYLEALVSANDEQSIEEFARLSGQAKSAGWTFSREEVHRPK